MCKAVIVANIIKKDALCMCASTPKLHKHPEAEGLIRQPDIGTQIKITLTAMIPFGIDKPNARRFRKTEFPRFSKSRIIDCII